MADSTDRDADRLDAWLNGDWSDGDELTDFASRILGEAVLPEELPSGLSHEQRDRIRARLFAGASDTEKARQTVEAITFAPNGATPMPIPLPERAAPSKLSVLMTAALVAIIVVAGFGLLRGGFGLPGGSDDPVPTGMPALAWSPVASPAAETDCSRDQMVSVFEGSVPGILQETAHATLDNGTLIWHCGGMTEQLAMGVRSASGVFWPGVIALVTEDDEVRLLNIASGTSLDLDGDLLLNDAGEIDFRGGFAWSGGPEPWLYTPANAEGTDWRIIDLRSMESLLLSDDLGDPLPEPSTPDIGQITGTDVGVVTWRPEDAYPSGTPFPGGVRQMVEQRALVLPGSLADRRWIDIMRYRDRTVMRGSASSQLFSVSPDGSLIAYPAVTDTFAPVIRVEDAVSGEQLVDVPVEQIDRHTRFILAGDDDAYLAVTNGATVRILGLAPDATREIATMPGPDVIGFYPTADANTILASTGTKSAMPIDVRTGVAEETWLYVPNVVVQLFGDYEMPMHLVRVVSAELGGTPATIQLVDPANGEVVLESDPVDAHPVQIISFNASLRNGGELAVVPIGYNRAVVLDAATGETWQIAAPVDDNRIWHFFPSYDGRFMTAYPEPPVGTTGLDEGDSWIAPLEPDAEWVPLEGVGGEASMPVPGTPAG